MVTRVDVEIFEAETEALLQDDAGRFVVNTGLKLYNRAKVLCPVDTGNLRASHSLEVIRGAGFVGAEVGTKVNYALPVHDGRGARTIRPRDKKALAFTWRGRRWVLPIVHQGPVRGRPWLRDALTEIAAQEGYRKTDTAPHGL